MCCGGEFSSFAVRLREDWWVTMLGAVMLALILYFGKILFDGVCPGYARWSAAVVLAFCANAWVPVSVRRLRDLGASRWWVVLGWVPVANIGLFIVLALRRGTDGRYAVNIAKLVAEHSVGGPNPDERQPEQFMAGRRGAANDVRQS